MYVDGHLSGRYGETHKVSALETLQFSTIGVVDDIKKCMTMDSKMPGDRVYIIGTTRNEMGGGEFYEHFGYVGLNVPEVQPEEFAALYRALSRAIESERAASVHAICRGGLGIHLAMVAMGGNLGMDIDLSAVPKKNVARNDVLLFSESAGRFIVTVPPDNHREFEKIFKTLPSACIGMVSSKSDFVIKGINGRPLVEATIPELKSAWKQTFGELT